MTDEVKTEDKSKTESVPLKQTTKARTMRSEHKRVKKAFEPSSQLFQALIQNALDAIVVISPELTVRYESPSMERLIGRKPNSRIGKNPLEFCHPEDTEKVTNEFIKLLENKIPHVDMEIRLQHRDGRWLIFELVGTNLIDDPEVRGIVLNLRDITQRKQIEDQYRALVEKMNDGLAVLSIDGLHTYVNDKYCEMTGYSNAELMGRSPLELMDEDNRDIFSREIVKRRKGKSDPYELEFIKKDGSRFIANISPQVVTDSVGEITGAFAVITDITRLKEVKEALLKSEQNLKYAQEMVHLGYWEWDSSTNEVVLSEEMQRILGSKQAKVKFSGSPKIIHPDDIVKLQEAITELQRGGNPRVEFRLVLPNGDTKWIQAGATHIDKDSDQSGKVFGYALDMTERKQLEDELRTSEEKLRQIFNSIEYCIVISDLQGNIVDQNDAALRYQGYNSKEEVIGKFGFEFITERDRSRAIQEAMESIERGYGSVEAIFQDKDGNEYDAEANAAILSDGSGNPVGFVTVTRDITERKRMEEALKDSEETLNQAQYLAKVGSWTWNLKDNSFRLSDEMGNLYGIEKREIRSLEDILNKFMHPDDREIVFEAAGKVLTEGYGDPLVYRIIKPDGEVRWMSATIPIVRHSDADGNPEVMVGAVQDITEQKHTEEKIRESEEKIRAIFDNVGVGITVLDAEGNIVDVNETVLKMKGYTREDVIGQFGLNFVAEKDRTKATNDMMDFFMAQEEKTPMREYTLLAKDGSEIPCEACSTLLHDSSGNLVGFVSVEIDITDRKRAEEMQKESEERLRAFMESSADIYAIFDSQLRLVEVSDRGVKEFLPDKTREEQIGKHIAEIVPEVMETGRYEEYLKVIETGKPFQVDETIMHPRFATRHISIKAFKVQEGIGMIFSDITGRKNAEQELRYYSERLRAMAKQLSEMEESQRRRTARELHDNVGQNLTALGINWSMAKKQLEKSRVEEVQSILDDSQQILEQTTEAIRDIMADLRPPVLEDYGLLAALRWYTDRFASRTGIATTVQGKEPDTRLSADIEIALFRIAQEALTNIAKHANASNVIVNFDRKDGRQRLSIFDDGIGFDTDELSRYTEQANWGLVIMSERADSIGASCEIESIPGIGTRVIVEKLSSC